MALSEVILEIAEEMIEGSESEEIEDFPRLIRAWAKQLKVAVKASEGTAQTAGMQYDEQGRGTLFLHPDAQHFQMIEKARQELRDQRRKFEAQEMGETRMAVCEGGPAEGETVPISVDMPAGAKCTIDGKVYVLSDGGVLKCEGASDG